VDAEGHLGGGHGANVVEVSGDTLTGTAFNEAISIINDMKLTVKIIVMRGWELDSQTRNDLRAKDVTKKYSMGGLLLTSAMPLDEILVLPGEEIGKMPVREAVNIKASKQKTRFKTNWLVWSNIGQGRHATQHPRDDQTRRGRSEWRVIIYISASFLAIGSSSIVPSVGLLLPIKELRSTRFWSPLST
jgi:hypothetical protein